LPACVDIASTGPRELEDIVDANKETAANLETTVCMQTSEDIVIAVDREASPADSVSFD
jgi:hypothetical protein